MSASRVIKGPRVYHQFFSQTQNSWDISHVSSNGEASALLWVPFSDSILLFGIMELLWTIQIETATYLLQRSISLWTKRSGNQIENQFIRQNRVNVHLLISSAFYQGQGSAKVVACHFVSCFVFVLSTSPCRRSHHHFDFTIESTHGALVILYDSCIQPFSITMGGSSGVACFSCKLIVRGRHDSGLTSTRPIEALRTVFQ